MMNERDRLYQAYKEADERRARQNFDAFMDGLESGIIPDLDNAYASGDSDKYNRLVSNIKSYGIRVFRNSAGKHKITFM